MNPSLRDVLAPLIDGFQHLRRFLHPGPFEFVKAVPDFLPFSRVQRLDVFDDLRGAHTERLVERPISRKLAFRPPSANIPTMADDRELLKALQRGDDRAWDEAFRRLYPAAFAAARHPLASLTPAEAEDVAVEALTLLLPKVKQVRAFDELRLLVITIASRKAISEKRRQLADKRGGGDVTSLDALRDDETIRFEPAEQVLERLNPADLRELGRLLDTALATLEPRQAELVRDFLMRHLSYKELATKYKMPIGSVGVSLARSLEKIRGHLQAMPKLWKELSAYLR